MQGSQPSTPIYSARYSSPRSFQATWLPIQQRYVMPGYTGPMGPSYEASNATGRMYHMSSHAANVSQYPIVINAQQGSAKGTQGRPNHINPTYSPSASSSQGIVLPNPYGNMFSPSISLAQYPMVINAQQGSIQSRPERPNHIHLTYPPGASVSQLPPPYNPNDNVHTVTKHEQANDCDLEGLRRSGRVAVYKLDATGEKPLKLIELPNEADIRKYTLPGDLEQAIEKYNQFLEQKESALKRCLGSNTEYPSKIHEFNLECAFYLKKNSGYVLENTIVNLSSISRLGDREKKAVIDMSLMIYTNENYRFVTENALNYVIAKELYDVLNRTERCSYLELNQLDMSTLIILGHFAYKDTKFPRRLKELVSKKTANETFFTSNLVSILSFINEPLDGLDLSNQNLSGAKLKGANLHNAKLSHSNLTGAVLSDAFLDGVDMSHSNFDKLDIGFTSQKKFSGKIQTILQLDRDNLVIATARDNIIWNHVADAEEKFYSGGEVKVLGLGKTKDGKPAIVFVETSNKISIWSVEEHKIVQTSDSIEGIISSIAYWEGSQGRQIVFFVMNDTILGWWDLASTSLVLRAPQNIYAYGRITPLKQKDNPVLIVCAKDGTIFEYSHATNDMKIIHQYSNKDFLGIVSVPSNKDTFIVTHKSAVEIVQYEKKWSVMKRIASTDYNFHQAITINHGNHGKYILTSDTERVGTLWTYDGEKIESYYGFKKTTTGVCAIVDNSDTFTVIVGDEEGFLRTWRTSPHKYGKGTKFFSSTVNYVSIEKMKQTGDLAVLSGSKDGSIQVRDTFTGRLLSNMTETSSAKLVVRTGLCGDKHVIVAGDSKGNIHIWDQTTFKLIRSVKPNDDKVMSVLFTEIDGEHVLVTLNEKGDVCVWDNQSDKPLVTGKARCGKGFELLDASQNGECVIYVLGGRFCRIVVTKDNIEVGDMVEFPITPLSGCLYREGQDEADEPLLVVASDDGVIYVYPIAEEMEEAKYELLDDDMDSKPYTVCILSLDGQQYVAAGYDTGDVLVWNPKESQIVCRFRAHRMDVVSVACYPQSSDNSILVTSSRDHTYRTWRVARRKNSDEGGDEENDGGNGDEDEDEEEEGKLPFVATLLNVPFSQLSTGSLSLTGVRNMSKSTKDILKSFA